ncbi:glycosyltransferase family 2 protein [Candidatus Woesearchaeota archaeon]|nr:glycosyltransferase family 2 protein [Candidatus Woesearchaeota archaeon]
MRNKRIIITIPAYNEEKTIGKVLDSIKKVMYNTGWPYQLLVIDDGSTDKTAAIAKKAGALVISHPQKYGLAEAFRTEIEKCLELDADVIVHTDADGQYRASEIPLLLKKIGEGYDFVLGSRFMGTIEEMPLIKRFGNKAFSRVISKIIDKKITDGQTGFRAFTKEVAKKVKITSNHTYTQEQIIRAVKEKFRIVEVPVHFDKRGGKTKSRLMKNPFEYALRAWINILRILRDYEPLKFFGYIGAVFFTCGFLIGLWVFFRFILTGVVGALPRVMVSVLFISIGVQIWLFGFLADMLRK